MKKSLLILFVLVSCFVLVTTSCSSNKIPAKEGWTLVWNDEFTGNALDTTKWDYQIGTGSQYGLDGWGNQEAQYYTPENVSVSDGMLVLEARKENKEGKAYTSGRIRTMKQDDTVLFATKFGRIEARMQLPKGSGIWPAFWMLPATTTYGGWPMSGEIDIMEARGRLPNRVYGAIHYGQPWPGHKYSDKMGKFPAGQTIADFHTYAVEWEPGVIRWFIDDEMYFETSSWWSMAPDGEEPYEYPAPYNEPFYILLNLAIGGTYDEYRMPGAADIPAKMLVDYVRVYEKTAGYNYDVTRPLPVRDTEAFDSYARTEDGSFALDPGFLTANKDGMTSNTMDKNSHDWYVLALSEFGGKGDATVKDGEIHLNVMEQGTEVHSMQLLQHMGIAKGYTYVITFDAKAEADRTIAVKLGGDDDNAWAVYSSQYYPALTSEYKSFKYKFTMEGESDPSARLEFNVGKNPNDVWIKNVKVTVSEF